MQQAHIHLGQRAQSGGIAVFLCTNLANGPAGTQACPAPPATITGTITPADVIGPAAQGIAAGEFGELTDAIRAGVTYVNVHSSLYPGGEIRAQLEPQNDDRLSRPSARPSVMVRPSGRTGTGAKAAGCCIIRHEAGDAAGNGAASTAQPLVD